MSEVYEAKSENLEALPVEKLFGEAEEDNDLLIDLCIEYGRKLALEDYIRMEGEKHYADVRVVRAILGMEGVEDE